MASYINMPFNDRTAALLSCAVYYDKADKEMRDKNTPSGWQRADVREHAESGMYCIWYKEVSIAYVSLPAGDFRIEETLAKSRWLYLADISFGINTLLRSIQDLQSETHHRPSKICQTVLRKFHSLTEACICVQENSSGGGTTCFTIMVSDYWLQAHAHEKM